MNQDLTCSLAALAILAFREGDYQNAARLLGQAAVSPDVECFLQNALTHNLGARALIASMTQDNRALAFGKSVVALSAAMDTDEEISISFGNETRDQALADELDAQSGQSEDFHQVAEDDAQTAIDEMPSELQATVMGEDLEPTPEVVSTSSPIKFNFGTK